MMTTDVRGCSTCAPGEEQYEQYHLSGTTGNRWTGAGTPSCRTRVQYDYRTPEGDLFSCIGLDLADCRRKRDHWLKHGRKYVSCSGMPRQTINA